MREMVGGCCVCSDERGWSENPLVYCDGQSCTVAVHQACYGIVTVPTGPWYCRKCESQERSAKVKCELCPSKYGALKRTDNAGWAHVVCALYIPEVRFGNVTTMEPIQLHLIPGERFNKVCYICEEKGKPANASVGACMQCNKAGCKQQFHVTCAQSLGLLCEEAGNYLDNVKYCGYCQHHYSKLKKGANVKTIPPYKPVSTENHLSDSSSEKDTETPTSTQAGLIKPSPPQPISTTATIKRKSSSSSKSSSKSSSSNTSKTNSSSSSSTKIISNSKSSDKPKVPSSSSTRKDDSGSADLVVDIKKEDSDGKDSKSGKKRKSNSRTPTPVATGGSTGDSVGAGDSDKKDTASNLDSQTDKTKKARIETTQSIISNQPIVALTSISTIKSLPVVTNTTEAITSETAQSVISQQPQQSSSSTVVNSLVVSVPLSSATLSPHPVINNQTSVLTSAPPALLDKPSPAIASERNSNNLASSALNIGNNSNSMISSDMNSGGLKITYESQDTTSITTEVDMELEAPNSPQEVPAKRTRSQSNDKTERTTTRNKKKGTNLSNSATNGITASISQPALSTATAPTKRASRSQTLASASPPQPQPGAFASISQAQVKDSPPSSPSSESQGAPPSRGRTKGRKSAPALNSSSSRDSKDIKLFQNGVTAPHMLGNQLNPTSNMAQKMSDHLSSELEAHSIFNPSENNQNLMGPQLHHRVIASVRASSTGSSTASGGSGLSSMLGGNGGNIPQTLAQLLERQWEQGSQFLMEQAQHFDIASLLSCLHQLRAENLRLEEHVSSLLQRRDHLLAVNARLAIPLTGQPATPQTSHAHTVNNIHPAVAASHGDVPRSRHSSASANYPTHPQASTPVENGLPTESSQAYQHSHRNSTAAQSQRSPTVRHSPATPGYSTNSGLLRQSADTSGRSAPRPQPYPLYQGSGTSSQQQVVIRRDGELHQSSKPS